MKRLLFIGMILVLATSVIQAQDSREKAGKITAQMKTDLQLTDEQVTAVTPVNEEFVSGLQSVKNTGGGRYSKMKKAREVADRRQGALKKILTKEQFEKFQEMQKEKKATARSMRKG